MSKEGEGVYIMVRKKVKKEIAKKPVKESVKETVKPKYQLFLLSKTERPAIYKAGRVVSIIKDRGEELYVVGPR